MPEILPAGVLILYRYRNSRLEILTVKRSDSLRAFPAAWTFPGGRLEAGDQINQNKEQAFQNCALREVFEELGILPGYLGELAELGFWRHKLQTAQIEFQQILKALDYTLPLEKMIPIQHRVTPDFAPIRFDTAYYLLQEEREWPLDLLSEELNQALWITPCDMLQRWYSGELIMPPPVQDIFKALVKGKIDQESLSALRAAANEDGSYPVLETHPGIHLLPLRTPTLPPAKHTNTYLIGNQRFLIVDPASPYPEEQEKLAALLASRLAQGARAEIVLTHHHQDHVGGVIALKKQFDLKVWAHPMTAAQVDFEVENVVEEGYRWDLGKDPYTDKNWLVEAWHTPGHASGHLCLIDWRHPVAIVGDMLAGIGSILIELPDGNMRDYLASLQRLADAELHFLFPAHGPVIHQPRQRCLEYIAHRLMRENKVLAALASEATELDALLPSVYSELDRKLYPLARSSLLAHLAKLMDEKRVKQNGEVFSLI